MSLREDLQVAEEMLRRSKIRYRKYRDFNLRRLAKLRDKISYLEAIVKENDTPTKRPKP
jgi:superfamily I DNA/RNA helicase